MTHSLTEALTSQSCPERWPDAPPPTLRIIYLSICLNKHSFGLCDAFTLDICTIQNGPPFICFLSPNSPSTYQSGPTGPFHGPDQLQSNENLITGATAIACFTANQSNCPLLPSKPVASSQLVLIVQNPHQYINLTKGATVPAVPKVHRRGHLGDTGPLPS